jgi:hypothetical protein
LEDEEKKKIYFVFEYMSNGVILSKEFWRNSIRIHKKKHPDHFDPSDCQEFPKYFEPEIAKKFFLQILKAVLYSTKK